VTLMHRREEFRGSPPLVDRVKAEPRITVKTQFSPAAIEGGNTVTGLRAAHVVTGETLLLPAAAVFVCAGTAANTETVKDLLKLDGEGRIKAGEDCETGVPGVYAAGDIRAKPLYQIVTAAADGAVAAAKAAIFIRSINL
jgi:thioredoxin reductase (NADPH)